MKKWFLSLTVLFFLFGCSGEENPADSLEGEISEETSSEELSLEGKIFDVMKEQDYLPENIVDYEIKDEFIYVFSYTIQKGLSVAILKHTPDSTEWIMGIEAIQTTSIGDPEENTPVLTVIQSDDPEVKNAKVFNQYAKLVQLTQELTDDYSTKVRYWIHFSEMNENFKNQENLPSENVEFIR